LSPRLRPPAPCRPARRSRIVRRRGQRGRLHRAREGRCPPDRRWSRQSILRMLVHTSRHRVVRTDPRRAL